MSVHTLPASRAADPVTQAKIQLAAAHRIAVLHELEEGIDNHFTVTVPGHDDRYLMLPFGLHWSEARASDMIVFDESGKTLEGEGDRRALRALHPRAHPPHHRRKRVVLHTHQTWAVALNMLKDNRLMPATQTAAFFCRDVAYDDTLPGHGRHARGRRAPREADRRQVHRLHEEPRRARGGRHRRRGLPAPLQAGARMPHAGAGDLDRASDRGALRRDRRARARPGRDGDAIRARNATACTSRR